MDWTTIATTGIYAAPLYFGMWMTWRKSRVVEQKVEQGVQKISAEVDGRLTQLLSVSKQVARAEGAKDEKARADFATATDTHTTLGDVMPSIVAVAAAVPMLEALAQMIPKIEAKLDPPPPTGEYTGLNLR